MRLAQQVAGDLVPGVVAVSECVPVGSRVELMLGWPPHVVARQAGHSRASVTLDIYSHVILDEPDFVMERIRGDASPAASPRPKHRRACKCRPFLREWALLGS